MFFALLALVIGCDFGATATTETEVATFAPTADSVTQIVDEQLSAGQELELEATVISDQHDDCVDLLEDGVDQCAESIAAAKTYENSAEVVVTISAH